MGEPTLLIETSGRGGRVGLAVGGRLLERALDPARRHARDLAPAVAELLAEAGLKPVGVRRVAVSVGPGSFTGLRVGIMSAKAFAYATGCELVAVPTFAAIAEDWPGQGSLHVLADGLQGLVYAEGFERTAAETRSVWPLRLLPLADWAAEWGGRVAVAGPAYGMAGGVPIQSPSLGAMVRVVGRIVPLSRDDMLGLEPLYLRGSSAEEKARA